MSQSPKMVDTVYLLSNKLLNSLTFQYFSINLQIILLLSHFIGRQAILSRPSKSRSLNLGELGFAYEHE